jgi:hypothetical protein
LGKVTRSIARLVSPLIMIGIVSENLSPELADLVTLKMAYRDTIIRIEEILRNESGQTLGSDLLVRNFGGTYDDVTYEASGQADFAPEEKVLLMLRPDDITRRFGPPHWRLTGGVVSKFKYDPKTAHVIHERYIDYLLDFKLDFKDENQRDKRDFGGGPSLSRSELNPLLQAFPYALDLTKANPYAADTSEKQQTQF